MATVWSGRWGDSNLRVGIDIEQSPATLTASTTEVTLTARYYVDAQYAINDAQVLTLTGAITGSIPYTLSTTGQRLIATRTLTVPVAVGASTSRTLTAQIDGYYSTGTPSVSATHTVPARPVGIPAAPTNVSATRVNDNRVDVAWANHPTASEPYEAVVVLRNDGVSDIYNVLAATATGWVDNTVQPNRAYTYAVRAWNAAGVSAFTDAPGVIRTTPAAPSGVKAVKTGATTATVSWTDNSRSETGFEVRRSVDGGAWSTIDTVGAGVTSFPDTATPGGSVVYSVRAVAGSLASGWSASSTAIQTIVAPAAPSVAPLPQWTILGEAREGSWAHNTRDGSAQTKAEVETTVNSAAPTAETVTGTTSTRTIDTSALTLGDTVKMRVRTWGLHADPSPWSVPAQTTIVAAPFAHITNPAPDATVTDLPLAVTWETGGHIAWDARLIRDGQTIKTGAGTTSSTWSIQPGELADDTTYTVALTIRDAYGHTATAERTFTTDFVAPAIPVLDAAFDPATGATSLVGVAGEDTAAPPTVALSLWRVEGERRTLITDDLTQGTVTVDPTPRLGASVAYDLVAQAASGATASAVVEVETTVAGAFFFNWGPGFTEFAVLDINVSLGQAPRRSKAVYHFAGRPRPSVFYGERQTRDLSISGELFDDPASEAAFRQLGHAASDVIYRTPRGECHRVTVEVDMSEGIGPRITRVDVSMVEVG